MKNVVEEITKKFVEALESGENPFWVKPFQGVYVQPQNFVTGVKYRGLNVFWLSLMDRERPLMYCTMKQANKQGWKVRKGSKARQVVFWKFFYLLDGEKVSEKEYREMSAEDRKACDKRAYVRYYNVFNIMDIDGVDLRDYVPEGNGEIEVIDECEQFVSNVGAEIEYGVADGAFYSPARDLIYITERKYHRSAEDYYHTLFHEIGHWTGHESRLNRELSMEQEKYSKEELIAEMSSAYMCAVNGIDMSEKELFENSVAYLQGWAKKLKEEKNWLMSAAQNAQKVLDFVMALQDEGEEQREEVA